MAKQISMGTSSKGIRCPHFQLYEIEEATRKFSTEMLIGEGGEAKVYKGKLGDIHVAVKHFKQACFQFKEELEMTSILNHDNVVSLVGHCQHSGEKILIYELMHNGSLADNLYKKPNFSQSWEQRLRISIGTARGLSYLHHGIYELPNGIIHRDVKPSNILLDGNWNAKISDFGLFKEGRMNQTTSAITTYFRGTGGYCAPEYFLFRKISRAIDVYAFGVVLFEVLCKKTPWDRDYSYYGQENENENLGLWAQQNVDLNLDGEISKDCLTKFTNIIHECLQKDPGRRPKMMDVVIALEHALRLQEHDVINSKKGNFGNNFHKVSPPQAQLPPNQSEYIPTTHSVKDDITNPSVSKFYLFGTEGRIVLYYTSLGAIKKTANDCQEIRSMLNMTGVAVDERDISLDKTFKDEYLRLFKGTGLGVPRLFIGGNYIGGAEEIMKHHAEGSFERLIEGFPCMESGQTCKNCGDARFVACQEKGCGTKFNAEGLVRCQSNCNEQGLIRCPRCCS